MKPFASKENIKRKRRVNTIFNKRRIGKNANEESLKRYCIEIWSEIIRDRDNNTCFMCGSNKELNSHHLITKKWLKTAFDINCGITLCRNCHDISVNSAHMSPWILESKLKETRTEQFNWYINNRMDISNSEQETPNYKNVLNGLLEYFEKISPTKVGRSNYFRFSEAEEQKITEELINSGTSYRDLAKKLGCGKNTIFEMIKRRNVNKSLKIQKERRKGVITHSTPVLKIDKENKITNEYESISDAARNNNILISSINNCLKGKSKTSGGFKWEYKNKYEN